MKHIIWLFLIPKLLLAQATPNAVVLSASGPQLMNPSQVNLQITPNGNPPAPKNWYIAVNYPIGSPGLTGPIQCSNCPDVNQGGGVTLTWTPQPGAISYDVLFTLTRNPAEAPPSPGNTYNYAASGGVGLTTTSFTCSQSCSSAVRQAYTVKIPVPVASCSIILDNIDAATPYMYVTPCVLNTGGGGGSTIVSGISPIQTTNPTAGTYDVLCPTCVTQVTGTGPIIVSPTGSVYNVSCPTCSTGSSTGTNNCVNNFGADPTGATDSTTALQNCINSLAPGGANEEGSVTIPTAKAPNFFYQCYGQLSWGSVIHGRVELQTGASLMACALPAVAPGAPQWITDYTTPTIIGYAGLDLPGTKSFMAQNYEICSTLNVCTALSGTGPGGLPSFSNGAWNTSVASIPLTYAVSQNAAIGSSGSPILLYTTPTNIALQNYQVCLLLVAESNGSDVGTVQANVAWTDLSNNPEVTSSTAVALATKSVNGGSCFPITPKSGTTISYYVTYTATGTSLYGFTGFLKPQ